MDTFSARTIWERAAMPLTGLSALGFAALARIRRNRVFHPVGEAFAGQLDLYDEASRCGLGPPTVDPVGVVLRFSRGAGVPEPFPDVLGLAIKIPLGEGAQDLLLASSGSGPGLRHTLLPVRSFLGCTYSSVLPYKVGSTQILFGARADAARQGGRGDLDELELMASSGDLSFDLLAAELLGGWETIGRLTVGEHLDQETSRALRFNPWNTRAGLHPAGPLNTLRKTAYKGSQEARPS